MCGNAQNIPCSFAAKHELSCVTQCCLEWGRYMARGRPVVHDARTVPTVSVIDIECILRLLLISVKKCKLRVWPIRMLVVSMKSDLLCRIKGRAGDVASPNSQYCVIE